MPEVELFGSKLCPYARRVRLALAEKGIDFWDTDIDLEKKPEWFLVIAPLGEVPVIRHEDRFIADSKAILEYLEDVYPDPSLRPMEPGKRAIARFWVSYADNHLAPAIERCMASPDEEQSCVAELRDRLMFIEREGLGRCGRGPYWLGAEPSIVDLAFYPFFEQLTESQQHRPVALPPTSIRLRYWLNAMRERHSVRAAVRDSVDSFARPIEGSGAAHPPTRSRSKAKQFTSLAGRQPEALRMTRQNG
jgi:glutathione S-transferase